MTGRSKWGRQQRFWTALESVPGIAAVPAEWKLLLGEEYESARRFFRPDGRIATSYPCTRSDNCGCTHGIILHAPDDIVAVCRCEPRRCEPFALTREDILVYEVDRQAVSNAVATALGAEPEHAAVPGLPLTWSTGTYSPYAGFRFPVYLAIQMEPEDLGRVIDALAARAEKPFVLVAPTRRMFGPQCEETLRRVDAYFLALDDDFALGPGGTIVSERSADEILKPFLSTVLPASRNESPVAFFPTPPDATWGAVRMRFKDRHTVSVQVKSAKGVFNYTQMGMANAKNGDPTKQWELLEAFAEGHGTLDWSSRHADRKNQKRKELLAGKLCEFFRIEGDPFGLTEDGKGWRTKFSLSLDG